MAQGITLPVNLLLENLLSIVKDMRSLLGNLKIGSSGYEKVSKVIADIEKRILNLQVLASRPFVDVKLFNEILKEILHAKDDLTKLGLEAGKIKFSDISLTSEQSNKLKEFDNLLKSINDLLKLVKESAKTAFLASDAGKAWKEANPVDATKSFEAITLKIEQEVNKLETAIARAKLAYEEYLNTTQSNEKYKNKINGLLKTGGTSLTDMLKLLGLLDKIFNSDLSRFKNNGRSILGDWLKDLFGLSLEAIDSIISESGLKVYLAFNDMSENVKKTLRSEKNRMLNDNKLKNAESNNGKTYTDAIASAEASHASAVAALRSATEADLKAAAAQAELLEQYNATKEKREESILGIIKEAQESAKMPEATDKMRQGLEKVGLGADQAKERLDSFDKAASKLSGISNFINRYIGIYAIMRRVTTAIRNAFNNIKELDKTITNIAVVTNMSLLDLWGKIGEYTQMAQQYGVTTLNVYTVSLLFYQQGLLTSLVMELTTETLKMAKIAGMDYSAAANAMTVAIRAFKIEMSDALSVTDTYSALAAKFAVSSAEIANAMEKTASSAANVGMSIESTSAFISVMVQTTRESAQNIGSALKSIISRYGEMKASPNELLNIDGEEVAFNKVDTALKSIGISIKDASGLFRDFDDVILELASKWDTLDNNTQRYIATIMAGNRQQSRFIALVSNYDELSRAMNVAENSENASIVLAAKTMDSLESKANLLKNAFSQLYLDLHFEDLLKGAYDWLTKIVTTIGKLGTLNGVLPTLMNIIGMGTGAKSLLGYGKEWIEALKNKHLLIDDEEANKRLDELNEKASKPETKKVTVLVDDSQLLAMNLTLNTTGINNAYGLVNKFGLKLTQSDFLANVRSNIPSLGDADFRQLFIEKLLGIKADNQNFSALDEFLNKLAEAPNSIDLLTKALDEATTATRLESLSKNEDTNETKNETSARKDSKSAIDQEKNARRNKSENDAGFSWGKNNWGSGKAFTYAGVATGFARMAGTVITANGAAVQDKSTDAIEGSKFWTGLGNGISMAGTGASMGMALGPWGAAIGGILGLVFGGLGAIIDSLEFTTKERIELAKKEAEEAKNESMKALAKTTSLSNSIDNLQDLRKAMYNSAEDMKAYKDAMNTLAEEYPQLISRYDEAGNAIIELNDAELLLLKTRAEGALKAREAAVKNLDAARTGLKGAVEGLTYVNSLVRDDRNGELYRTSDEGVRTWWNNGAKTNYHPSYTQNIEKGTLFDDLTTEEKINVMKAYYLTKLNRFIPSVDLTTFNSELVKTGALGDKKSIWDYLGIKEGAPLDANQWSLLLNLLEGSVMIADETVKNLTKVANQAMSQEKLLSSVISSPVLSSEEMERVLTKGIYSSLFTNMAESILPTDKYTDLNDWATKDASDYNALMNNLATRFINWYNNLSDKTRDLLESLDFTEYKNADEIINILGITDKEIQDAIRTLFESSNKSNRNRILETIFDTTENIEDAAINGVMTGLRSLTNNDLLLVKDIAKEIGANDKIISKYTDFFTNELIEINKLAENGYKELASTRLEILDSFKNALMNMDSTMQSALFPIITDIDFSDYASVTKAYELIENYGRENNVEDKVKPLLTILTGALDSLVFNITTLVLEITNAAKTAAARVTEILANNKSGFALDKALEEYEKLLALDSNLSFDQVFTFDPILKRYVYTREGLVLALDAEEKALDQRVELATNTLELYTKTIGGNLGKFSTGDLNTAEYDTRVTRKNWNDGAALGKTTKDWNEFQSWLLDWYLLDLNDPIIDAVLKRMQATEKEFKPERFFEILAELINSGEKALFDSDEIINILTQQFEITDEKALAEYRKLAEQYMSTEGDHTWKGWIEFLETAIQDQQIEFDKGMAVVNAERKAILSEYYANIDWGALATGTDFTGTNLLSAGMLAEKLGVTPVASYENGRLVSKYNWEDILLKSIDEFYGTEEEINKIVDELEKKKAKAARDAALAAAYGEIKKTKSDLVITAVNEILAGEGLILSAASIALISQTNGLNIRMTDGVVDAGLDFVSSAIALYNAHRENLLSTTERNNTYAEIIKKSYEKNNTILETYKSASALSTDAIGNLFNILDIDLDTVFDAATLEWTDEVLAKIFSTDMFGNTRIIDWEAFNVLIVKKLTPEEYALFIKTDEYLSAFKAYNNSMIEMDRKVAKEITSEVKSIGEAKQGERLNISYLWSSMDANLQAGLVTILAQYDATIKDGILTLGNAANIPLILSAVAAAAREAGQLLPSEIAELNDALINYFKSLNDLISKGISGTLTNVEATSLSESFNLDLNADFIRTADGLKLTHEAALKVYNDIKNIDSTAGNITFKALSDSLIETDEHYKTISSTLARIDELNKLIADEKISQARKQLYELELALAKEIAAVRATTEDNSYSFMSNKIPGGLNNPLNYFSNWLKGWKVFTDARKSGYMDYTDFFNLFTEMGHMAEATGQKIQIGADSFLTNSTDAAALIKAGAGALEVDATTGELRVNLAKLASIGVDFSAAGEKMDKDVTDGIKKYAESQVKMLDGMILVLETVVAMEKLGDITGDNDTIDIDDLFPEVKWPEGTKLEISNETAKTWIQLLLDIKDTNDDLYKALDGIFINGKRLRGLMHDSINGGLTQEDATDLTNILNVLWQMYLSGEYDINSIFESMKAVAASTGFEGTILFGDMKLIFTGGEIYTEVEIGGETKILTPDGLTYNTVEEARNAALTDKINKLVEQSNGGIQINDKKVSIFPNYLEEVHLLITDDGYLEYDGKQYKSIEDFLKVYYAEYIGEDKLYANVQELMIDLEIIITPTITDGNLNEDLIAKIKSLGIKTYDQLLREWNAAVASETEFKFAAKYGFRLDGVEFTEELITQINELLADEVKTITFTVVNNEALSAIDEVRRALALIPNSKTTYVDVKERKESTTTSTPAAGKNATASAKGTLMGELGPEMVVSNGRYFIVGLNGPEMIDLADDAIVFNHLLTKSLLEKGITSTRGKAVTNECNAVSFAKGNVHGGPALASAQAALETLKELRSMWESIAGMSVKDLAGKGGGGGGGGKNKDAGFVKELERWYNYLQEIAKLEEKITYEETLRSKINSDFYKDGYEYYRSLMRSAKDLTREIATLKQLVEELLKYFEARRKQMNDASNPFSMLYTFDEAGQLKYRDGAFAKLSELASSDPLTGIPNHSLQEQYDQLIAWGFGDYMRYDESGKEIDTKDETGLKSAVKAFWDRIESDRTEMQGLHDSIEEHKKALLKKQEEQNKILKDIEDNQISLEGKVLKAIEDAAQREIDTLSDLKEVIQEANTALIDGLTNALLKELQMYLNQLNLDELTRLQRLLGILQRSGGSASQIRDLLKQIDEKNRDMYFNKLQEQIDAIQEASDKEIERLEQLINLMTETLEYQKANGLLWEQVYAIMNENTAELIAEFIKLNDAEYWAKSPTDMALTMRDVLFSAELWKAFAEDGGMTGIKAELDALMALLEKAYGDLLKADEDAAAAATEANEAINANTNSGSGSGNEKKDWETKKYTWTFGLIDKNGSFTTATVDANTEEGAMKLADKKAAAAGGKRTGAVKKLEQKPVVSADVGGILDEDQLALVHAKEAVFTPEQTSILRNDILGHGSDSLLNLLSDFRTAWAGMASSGDYNSIDRSSSVVIEHAEVNMKVDKLANSYDAARAGKDVMEEMLHIASKTRAQNRVI